jgi:hypothetical protein
MLMLEGTCSVMPCDPRNSGQLLFQINRIPVPDSRRITISNANQGLVASYVPSLANTAWTYNFMPFPLPLDE